MHCLFGFIREALWCFVFCSVVRCIISSAVHMVCACSHGDGHALGTLCILCGSCSCWHSALSAGFLSAGSYQLQGSKTQKPKASSDFCHCLLIKLIYVRAKEKKCFLKKLAEESMLTVTGILHKYHK